MLDQSYICVIIDNEKYYREVLEKENDKLGELISEEEFREMLLEEALSQVVDEAYHVNLNRIHRIVENITDFGDRQVMKDFVEYVLRIDGIF